MALEVRFLLVKEVAQILRCKRQAVYKLITLGKIRAIKVRGKWLIPVSEMNRLLGEIEGEKVEV
jgi:excisionase family DNA binding protein